MFLKISQNSRENTFARVSFLIKLQVFYCEFCEIFKNTFFTEHLQKTASRFHLRISNKQIGLFERSMIFQVIKFELTSFNSNMKIMKILNIPQETKEMHWDVRFLRINVSKNLRKGNGENSFLFLCFQEKKNWFLTVSLLTPPFKKLFLHLKCSLMW